jgi:AcrR family transcriptional regulator
MDGLRRTQVERSAHTRGVLVEAAVESLVDRGWAATTAVEVCRRTGLTRGALVHHFPSLSGLLAAALESVCDELVGAVPEPVTLVDAVDVTWACVRAPHFKAVIEAWMAAANDPELRREIGPVVARFSKLVHPDGALHDVLADDDGARFYLLARETMLGLALGRAISSGRALPHEAGVIEQLRTEAAAIDRARERRARTKGRKA